MHPIAYSGYSPPLGVLPTLLFCVVMTVFLVWWANTPDEDTARQRARRMNLKLNKKDRSIKTVMAQPNWRGLPRDGLTRKEVYDKIKVVPLATEIPPCRCPVCGLELNSYNSAFDVKEKVFDVQGVFCSNGHWTWLTWN